MFVVLLKFGTNKSRAPDFMEGHKKWIKDGFDAGVFAVVGKLVPHAGGAVLAFNLSRSDLEARIAKDPFVEHGIVEFEVIEFEPMMTMEGLDFLKG